VHVACQGWRLTGPKRIGPGGMSEPKPGERPDVEGVFERLRQRLDDIVPMPRKTVEVLATLLGGLDARREVRWRKREHRVKNRNERQRRALSRRKARR